MSRREAKKSFASELSSGLLGSTAAKHNAAETSPVKHVDSTRRHSAFAGAPEKVTTSPLASSTSNVQSLSRRSSSNMSEPVSEEDSDDDGLHSDSKSGLSFRERRREAHTQAEQKRRDAIKKGYQELEEELPSLQDTIGSQKPSKAVVMQRSIDYVHYLEEQKKKSVEELDALKKDFMGLQIMKQTYEKMATAMLQQPDQGLNPVSDDVKFKVFQSIMDNLFQSYDARVNADSFAELSGSAFNWLEESGTPHNLRNITAEVLRDVKNNTGAGKR
ncbi:hypothetical protein RvY_07662 [Ramazzottius varieornatus]|uniref:BHLH domain-containing protein n=1 Tax=Ramazzottius varieornatus TaxID=947166 RepID=A0A1D1V918_RAMVA|nr:hypothetical protein RvY_07662 [Ramazzottius varieornatus]